MQDELSPLYGQETAISLVREFMVREDRGNEVRNRRTPILVFTGPRGIGKTTLLTQLQRELRGVPHAYIDCAGPIENPQDILLLLAFFLNRESGGYGRLPFRRFITGEIVINADIKLDITNSKAACEQISKELARHKKTAAALEAIADTMAKVAATLAGSAGWAGTDPGSGLVGKYGADLARCVLGSSRLGRNILFGSGQDWYQGQGSGGSSLEVLVSLKQQADRAAACKAEGDGDRRDVARLLWAAFLEDLRDSFRGRGDASDQILNCVVMLDNADTAKGRSFLEELLEARKQREYEPDPLTVVATSRGQLLADWVSRSGVTTLADASYDHYLQRGELGLAKWWYPVLLPPLSWARTRDMVSALRPRGEDDHHAVAAAVHAFTGGHPGATQTLLAVMGERMKSSADLSVILNEPEPGSLAERKRTAEESMLADLLGRMPTAEDEDLVTCAAARDRSAAWQLADHSGLLEKLSDKEQTMFATEFWSGGQADGPVLLQPLLRRLLLRRLARREPTARASWTAVHEWLCTDGADAGDTESELYHRLALADEAQPEHVSQVVDRLWPANTSAGDWLRLVARVTAAPNRLDHQRELEKVKDLVCRLTEWAEEGDSRLGSVARLVVSSWLGTDPLSAPHWRWLLRFMASELDLIAPEFTSKDLAVLREEAHRYRDTANGSWSEVEDFWVARTALSAGTIREANR